MNLSSISGALQRWSVDNSAGAGDVTVKAGATGFTIRVYAISLHAAGATTVTLKDGTTALEGARTLGTGITWNDGIFSDPRPRYELTSGNALKLNVGSAIQVSGSVWGTALPDTGGAS